MKSAILWGITTTQGEEETTNFKALFDADLITNLEEENKKKTMNRERLQRIIAKSFLTESGKLKAEEILLNKGE